MLLMDLHTTYLTREYIYIITSLRTEGKDLLVGPLDKTAYLVVKNVNAEKYRTHPNLTELYEKNGFVFFKRPPNR